jgi:amidase
METDATKASAARALGFMVPPAEGFANAKEIGLSWNCHLRLPALIAQQARNVRSAHICKARSQGGTTHALRLGQNRTMDRRDFMKTGLGGAAMTAVTPHAPSATSRWDEATVAQLRAALDAHKVSARELAAHYLARIEKLDRRGPHINSVIELNPQALAIAAQLDDEARAGRVRGPLHGIPVMVKDNIASADAMSTTAGSIALAGIAPPRDAFLVSRLRAAGAVILGKTNLSEWANIRSTRSTSGWSSRGGLTRNPYALDRNTSGSSSGSGAAVAANLCAIAVGTETDGSIVSPSSINGLVGIKPTVGLVSRDGIIPISCSQDTAGPMARTVADAAALLSAIAGPDANDPATEDAQGEPADYTRFLDARSLAGARIGVARNFLGRNDDVRAVTETALRALADQGAILVDVEMPNVDKYDDSELEVLLTELKAGLASYLATFAPGAPVATLEDVIRYNERNRGRVMPFFGQEHFIAAQRKGGLDDAEYLAAFANGRRYAREEGIDQVLEENNLDALVASTGGPAWVTDLVNGDHYTGSFSSPAAVAGYPHVTVPAGFVHGLPVGLSFVGTAWSEPRLIAFAYAFEQATTHRAPPAFAPTIDARA